MSLTAILATLVDAAKIANGSVRLYGVNYSLRSGPDWDPNRCKSAEQAQKELQQLKADITDNIRIYSMTDCDSAELLLQLTRDAGLGLWMGIWVQDDPAFFDVERAKLSELLESSSDMSHVIGIHVSSEAIYRQELTVAQAIEYRNIIQGDVAAADLDIPVTIADIVDNFQDSPELITADDKAVTMNHFGFFSPKTDLNQAADWLETQYAQVEALGGDRQIIVSETGWPDAGVITSSDSVANPAGMAKYLRDFVCLAEVRGWQYFWFTSYDSDWRRRQENDPDSVEGHFGLFEENGVLKSYLQELTIDCSEGATVVDLTDEQFQSTSTVSDSTSGGATVGARLWSWRNGAFYCAMLGALVLL